jgi:hypothetical protein
MSVGFIKRFNLMYIKQMLMPVGIFNGIFQSLVNLHSIIKANIMTGIVMGGIDLIKEKKGILLMEKLESCL